MLGLPLLLAGPALAHSPLCSCFDNGDGTVTCEGGFSDGSSAAGVKMLVLDGSGKTLIEGKMNKDGEYSFKKPAGAYKVLLMPVKATRWKWTAPRSSSNFLRHNGY